MRIERIEIDGFGRFHDAVWAFEDGLTVLLGANEAGKTTLLNALRALFFGFESTRDRRTWYPALAGGRRGGRLILLTGDGERWTVERHGDRGGGGALAVRAPNGNQGGQETLDRLLHGADGSLFNNIFAFGLSELQTFDTLSADGVRGRIYGAGAGLGGTSAVDLERRLRQA
ncbi:MAG: AAA family ATPase, partial [Chloroflexota bacterium]